MGKGNLTAVQYGIGPIGAAIVSVAVDRGIEFVGAVDIDPEKIDEDLGRVAGLDTELGITVTADDSEALATDPELVFHSTVSSIDEAAPQLETIMDAGADVVSTCEELAYPWRSHPKTAARLENAANNAQSTCLGTGINPGFAMDTLPIVLTAASQTVERIRVKRVQDGATRRPPLQAKIGAGTDVETFQDEIAPEAGHTGLPESVAMLADALGFSLDEVTERLDPVISEDRVTSAFTTVEPGDVAGIHQIATGCVDGEVVVQLDLQIYNGAPDPHDAVTVMGTPDVSVTVDGGFHGDVTTPGVVVNAGLGLQAMPPGLTTMVEMPVPRYRRMA